MSAEAIDRALESAREATERHNAFAIIDAEGAHGTAALLERLPEAARGPLHGVPISVKDLFNVAGLPTRAGTMAPLPALGPAEATAVTRLRAAGAVIIGKTNLHEVALGLTGQNPWTGDVTNPHDDARMAGGSSSGSAVAVACGAGSVSLGTDTAGSLRLPAGFCGVTAFRPSYGRVPLDGALPLSPSMDAAGPIARTIADVVRVTEVLMGESLHLPAPGRPPRFGVPSAYLRGRLSAAVRAVFERYVSEIGDVDEIDIPRLEDARELQTLVGWPEAYAVHRHDLETTPEGFSPQVRTALERGGSISRAERAAAVERRMAMTLALDAALASVDALLVPAAPVVAPELGITEVELDAGRAGLRESLLDLLAPFSLAGLPVLSLPCGRTGGLPVNVQVVAGRGEDARCLSLGAWLEAPRG